jgi:hypothetical protein
MGSGCRWGAVVAVPEELGVQQRVLQCQSRTAGHAGCFHKAGSSSSSNTFQREVGHSTWPAATAFTHLTQKGLAAAVLGHITCMCRGMHGAC